MDLLRQIFLRLPAEKLTADENLMRAWIKQKIRISDEKLVSYLGKLGPLHLANLAGDVIPDLMDIIPRRMILARLAFLQRSDMYSASRHISVDIDLALISGVPEIQRIALEVAWDAFDIPDPEIIPWTPELVARYNDLIRLFSMNPATLRLAGYLHIDIPSDIPPGMRIHYFKGYVQREMQGADRFTQSAKIDRVLRLSGVPNRDLYLIYLYAGYFPHMMSTERSLDKALGYVWPELVRRLRDRIVTTDNVAIPPDISITRDLVKRAKEMLLLLDELRIGNSRYRAQLQAICGFPIGPDYRKLAIDMMITVAHPEVTSDMLSCPVDVSRKSSVYYDLVHYFSVFPRRHSRSGEIFFDKKDSTIRKLVLLYAQGGLLKVYQPEDIPGLLENLQKV